MSAETAKGLWIRVAPSVADQPSATMREWRILRVRGQHDHLVGLCLETITARITTPVQCFDPVAMAVITRSSRLYRLEGPPGARTREFIVGINAQLSRRGLSTDEIKDVTREYVPKDEGL